jgi:hypothetical protein
LFSLTFWDKVLLCSLDVNSRFFCLSLSSAGITGVLYHSWLTVFLGHSAVVGAKTEQRWLATPEKGRLGVNEDSCGSRQHGHLLAGCSHVYREHWPMSWSKLRFVFLFLDVYITSLIHILMEFSP